MGPTTRKVTAAAIAVPTALAAAGLSWIGYQSCTLIVADVPGAPSMGCGSTEYSYFAVAAALFVAAVISLWIGLRRRT